MPFFKTITASALLSIAAFVPLTPKSAEAAQNGFRGQQRISVQSAQYPRLAEKIERNLAQQLRQRYSRTAPIHIQLGNTRIDPRLRIRGRRQVWEPLRRRGRGFNQRCGPETLVYDAVRGQVRASYTLRYQASSRAFGQVREKAKGKVRANFQTAQNAGIISRCGWQPANPRQIRHLTGDGTGRGLKPLRLAQDALAHNIAQDIARDLRGPLRSRPIVQFQDRKNTGDQRAFNSRTRY